MLRVGARVACFSELLDIIVKRCPTPRGQSAEIVKAKARKRAGRAEPTE